MDGLPADGRRSPSGWGDRDRGSPVRRRRPEGRVKGVEAPSDLGPPHGRRRASVPTKTRARRSCSRRDSGGEGAGSRQAYGRLQGPPGDVGCVQLSHDHETVFALRVRCRSGRSVYQNPRTAGIEAQFQRALLGYANRRSPSRIRARYLARLPHARGRTRARRFGNPVLI